MAVTTLVTGPLTIRDGHVVAPVVTVDVDLTLVGASSPPGPPGPAASTPILEQIWQSFDSNADPVDALITSGSYVVFLFFASHNANSWKAATNATYTVPAASKLIVLYRLASSNVLDTARDGRLFNVTDSAAVDTVSDGANRTSGVALWSGDDTTPSKAPEVATGKTVRAEIWNSNTVKRAFGVAYVCRKVAA